MKRIHRTLTIAAVCCLGLSLLALPVLADSHGDKADGQGSCQKAEKSGCNKTAEKGRCCGKAGKEGCCKKAGESCDKKQDGKCGMCKKRHMKMAEVKKQLAAAKEAVQAGDKAAALEAIEKAEKALPSGKMMKHRCGHDAKAGQCDKAHKGHKGHMHKGEQSAAVNTTCPIMGGKVDPKNVPSNLTRQYNGQTVGFCCAACPPAWDKLSDEQKAQKLQAVK